MNVHEKINIRSHFIKDYSKICRAKRPYIANVYVVEEYRDKPFTEFLSGHETTRKNVRRVTFLNKF